MGLLGLGLLLSSCVPPPFRSQSTTAPEPRPEAIAPRLEDWKETAAELRELPFLDPVRVEWIDAASIGEIVREEIARSFDAEYIESYRDAYAMLGVLPPEIDLLEAVLRLQSEQLVGLYSLARETLYIVVDAPHDYEDGTILVHELVHALQHQHFPRTMQLLQSLANNDDVASALGAIVEGDASLTMLAVDFRGTRDAPVAAAERFQTAMLVDVEHPTGLMAEVPTLLRVSLIAPYAYGVVLAAHRFADRGNLGLDGLLADPPISMLQVMYPDEPGPIEFLRLPTDWIESELRMQGCRARHHNVAGVVTLGVLFEEFSELDPEPWLRAWRGDRFLHLECGERDRLVWVLRFRTADAAEAFAGQYETIAGSAAERAGLDRPHVVRVSGRSAVVLSADLAPIAAGIVDRIDSRAYDSLDDWAGEGCFPAAGCERATAAPAAAPAIGAARIGG